MTKRDSGCGGCENATVVAVVDKTRQWWLFDDVTRLGEAAGHDGCVINIGSSSNMPDLEKKLSK